jgi:hypothetical protein
MSQIKLRRLSPEEVTSLDVSAVTSDTLQIASGILEDVRKGGEKALLEHAVRLKDIPFFVLFAFCKFVYVFVCLLCYCVIVFVLLVFVCVCVIFVFVFVFLLCDCVCFACICLCLCYFCVCLCL